VEVEADLPDGDDPLVAREPAQLVIGGASGQLCLVRMYTRGGGQVESLCHRDRAPVPRFRIHAADDQHRLHTGRARLGDDGVAIGIELRHVDVAVGVDQSQVRTIGRSDATALSSAI